MVISPAPVGGTSRRSPVADYLLVWTERSRWCGLGVDVLYVPGNHDHPDLSFMGNVDGEVSAWVSSVSPASAEQGPIVWACHEGTRTRSADGNTPK